MIIFLTSCAYGPGRIASALFGHGEIVYVPAEYRVYKAVASPAMLAVKASGRLECVKEYNVSVPDGMWGARIEKLADEGGIVQSGEVICVLSTTYIESNLTRAQTELGNAEAEFDDAKMQNDLEEMTKKIETKKKDLQYEVSLFKLGRIKLGADTIDVAISNINIEKNIAFINNFESKLKLQKELLNKGFLSSFQFEEMELEYQRNILEADQNRNRLEILRDTPLSEEVVKARTTAEKLDFDRVLTAREFDTFVSLNKIEEDKKMLNIKEKQHKVAQAKSMIEKAVIKAPFSGTLLYSKGWNGKTRVGMEVWSGLEILKIVDMKNMKILVRVNEKYIDKFKKSDPAKIVLSSEPSRTLNGYVESISQLAKLKDEKNPKGPKEFDVTVYFSETSEAGLLPNMAADVNIICDSFEVAAKVPKDFAANGVFNVSAPASAVVELNEAAVGKTFENNVKKPYALGGMDDDYYYLVNTPGEFNVEIPQKEVGTVENGI